MRMIGADMIVPDTPGESDSDQRLNFRGQKQGGQRGTSDLVLSGGMDSVPNDTVSLQDKLIPFV